MEMNILIWLAFGFAGGYLGVWIPHRLRNTQDFLQGLNELAYSYSMRHLDEIQEDPTLDAYVWFMSKSPSFEDCLFSLRPLTLDRWFEKELIERIIS